MFPTHQRSTLVQSIIRLNYQTYRVLHGSLLGTRESDLTNDERDIPLLLRYPPITLNVFTHARKCVSNLFLCLESVDRTAFTRQQYVQTTNTNGPVMPSS